MGTARLKQQVRDVYATTAAALHGDGGDGDDEDEEEERGGGGVERAEPKGPATSGKKGRKGKKQEESDEDIDEDEAFTAADYELYGDIGKQSKVRARATPTGRVSTRTDAACGHAARQSGKSKRARAKDDEDDEEEEEEEDDDDDDGEMVDLVDLLPGSNRRSGIACPAPAPRRPSPGRLNGGMRAGRWLCDGDGRIAADLGRGRRRGRTGARGAAGGWPGPSGAAQRRRAPCGRAHRAR